MKQRTEHHPLYGDIPLVERNPKGRDGTVHTWWQYDPAFKPPLPKNAVRGDVSRQSFCAAHHVPKYFYVDEEKTCVQCGAEFVFSAKEQKYWYESLRFNFNSTAIRCRNCRRRRQTERALREQIAVALHQISKDSNDPAALLELARATVRYRERTGQGNLDRAIAAARKAKREWPASAEAMFWEGKCHRLAGRLEKALASLSRFIEKAGSRTRLKRLVVEAELELVELKTTKEA